MNKKWEDVYPKQFDIVWARFQGYDDVTYDKIENYHDQRRPYLVLFFKDNLYYCLKVTTKFHCGAFAFGKEYVGPNAALCLIKRTDFTGIKSELKGAGRSNLINWLTIKHNLARLPWSEEEYTYFVDSLKKCDIGDIVTIPYTVGTYIILMENSHNFLVSEYQKRTGLFSLSKSEFFNRKGNDLPYAASVLHCDKVASGFDPFNKGYLINYKRSRFISLYSEDDFVFCFDIDNRRIVRFDYINFLTFHVQMIYSLEEKYKHLKMYGGCDERLDAALNSYEELLNQQKRNLKDNNN